MPLEKVILYGFKSFADKTEATLTPGITGIVGPNGCGKSNISDAIRWALGEQSAKSLRGHRMEDVIFHGSASRKPIGIAEVSLIFGNEDGVFQLPVNQVMVTRRLYRDGESEYLLNKTPAKLRDITDLFLGTGVHPKAYGMMDQERLAHVLTAKPVDRRLLIEEAAGISRYKHQRAEALAKLEATRQNLLRVRDVMEEVRRQLGTLERQAQRAKRYKALVAEREALEVAIWAAEYAALLGESRGTDALLAERRGSAERLQVTLSGQDAEMARLRESLMGEEGRLNELRLEAQKAEAALARLWERGNSLRAQMEEQREEAERLGQERDALLLRVETFRSDAGEKRQAHVVLLGQREAEEGVALEIEARLGALKEALGQARSVLGARRSEQIQLMERLSDFTIAIGGLRERRQQLSLRAERVRLERDATQAGSERLRERLEGLTRQRIDLSAALEALERERVGIRARQEEAARTKAREAERLGELRLELASVTSRREALELLDRQREGYDQGVKRIFEAKEAQRLGGILGTVADLIEVQPQAEIAVGAALGERLQWIVVDSFAHALAALQFLATTGGHATFFPLDSPEQHNGLPQPPPADGNGLVRELAQFVECPPAIMKIFHRLLDGVFLAPDLKTAEAAWRENGNRSYVTPAGEVLHALGWLARGQGGGEGGPDHSLLGRKRTIRQLNEARGHLEEQIRVGERRLAEVEEQLAALESERQSLDVRLRQLEEDALHLERDREEGIREEVRFDSLLKSLGQELSQIEAEDLLVARDLAGKEQELSRAEGAVARLAEEIGTLQVALQGQESQDEELSQTLTKARVEISSLTERCEATQREAAQLEERITETLTRIQQTEERRVMLEQRRIATKADLEANDAQAMELGRRRAATGEQVAAQAQVQQDLAARLRSMEQNRRETEGELTQATTLAHQAEMRLAELRVRQEDLERQSLQQHRLDPGELLARHDPERDLTASEQALREVEGKIAALEPVNLVADEEYQALQERFEYLRTQHDDLARSIKDLEQAIRGMTRTAQQRFLEALEKINANFQEIFQRLFEGGRAELRIIESEDELESGVELVAQPRGKRLQSVTLLSGGEKALTGLALLFAIFYYHPSPFCLLDEVDAPLDDANIHRFLRVLGELAAQTQFLIITHNRKTMEAADVLYGVTMQEPGLSQLVSVRLQAESPA